MQDALQIVLHLRFIDHLACSSSPSASPQSVEVMRTQPRTDISVGVVAVVREHPEGKCFDNISGTHGKLEMIFGNDTLLQSSNGTA